VNKSTLRLFIIFLLTLVIGIGFRLYPLLNHTKGNSEEKAAVYLIAKIKQNIHNQVATKYSRLNPEEAKILEKRLFDEHFHKNGPQIRKQIYSLSKKMSARSDEGYSYPYLLASDSYYYLSLTNRILEKGSISEFVRANKYFNELMLAPNGQWEPLSLHPYIGATLFKFMRLFNPTIDVVYAVSFLPLILTALSLFAFILLFAQINFHPMSICIGSIFFLLAPIHMKRSMFGWYDNDPYNILFPLLILNILFLIFKQKSLQGALCYSGLIIALLGLYAYFWQGWIFMLVFTLAAVLLVSLSSLSYRKFADFRKTASAFILILFGSIALASLLFGPHAFFSLFQEGLSALTNFLSPQLSAWPDLYINVGELHSSEFTLIIKQLGGFVFIGISLLGLIYSFIRYWNNEFFIPITLFLLSLASLLMGLGAQRFIFLMVIPFSVAFVFGIESLLVMLKVFWEKILTDPRQVLIAKILTLSISLFLIIIPVHWLKDSIRSLLNPFFNPVWEEVLVDISERTPKDSIITTWWPPGHFIKAFARRAVTFDGASINVPQAYWVANLFLSQDETQALGILRMLHSGGNKAVEEFQSMGLDLPTSVLAVKDIVARPRSEAHNILMRVTKSDRKTQKILDQSHSLPPPSYLLIYNQFVENNIQLKFFGNWNFQAIENLNNNPKELKKIPKTSSNEFIQFLWFLAGGPYKYSGVLPLISQNDTVMTFPENISIQHDSMSTQILSENFGEGMPESIFYLSDGKIVEKSMPSPNLPFSVILFEKWGNKNIILLDRPLARSLLMKLYFFDGAGLNYIKPYLAKRDLTGRTQIQVFEVDWPKFISEFEN